MRIDAQEVQVVTGRQVSLHELGAGIIRASWLPVPGAGAMSIRFP